jgi:hypothetical protein
LEGQIDAVVRFSDGLPALLHDHLQEPLALQQNRRHHHQRYEEKLNGDYFLQADLRLTKYIKIGGTKVGIFAEALNVLNRENILNYDAPTMTHGMNWAEILTAPTIVPWISTATRTSASRANCMQVSSSSFTGNRLIKILPIRGEIG